LEAASEIRAPHLFEAAVLSIPKAAFIGLLLEISFARFMFSFSNSREDRCHDFCGRVDMDKSRDVDWQDSSILTQNRLAALTN
jgi:hypothetical protein